MLLCDVCHITILHIHALASHLGTLDEPREGRDFGTEPEDRVGESIQKMEGLSKR